VLFGKSVVWKACEVPGVVRVQAKYVVLVQLLLVQVTIPQAYFIGHLGGNLAALTYLRPCGDAAGPIGLLT
jgi:hypothetical protein